VAKLIGMTTDKDKNVLIYFWKGNMIITTTFLQSLFIILFVIISVRGQSAGDFQTNQSGNWNATTSWERWNGGSWITPAPNVPSSTDGVITIQNGHTITVTAVASADQMIINSGGIVNLQATLNIENDADADLTINGTLNNSTGTLIVKNLSEVVVNGLYEVSNSPGSTSLKNNATMVFNSASTYRHSRNGGSLPAENKTTWDVNATSEVTGVVGSGPGNLYQNYGNFIWNSTGQTGNFNFGKNFTTVNGNFTIISTGAGQIQLAQSGNSVINIGGNFLQTGGKLITTTTGNRTINVTGNFAVSNGTFDFSEKNSGTATVLLNIDGNFSNTGGTITKSGNASNIVATIVFTKNGSQTYTSGGTITNLVNFTVNSGSTLQMAAASSVVEGGGTFTLSSGATIGITSTAGITSSGATGNIQVTGTRTYSVGANYTYNGVASQNVGNGFPNNLSGTLTTDNSGNIVTLDNARTIASGGSIVLTAGTFAVGSNLTMASTFSITRNGGDMTGTPQGSGTYNIIYTGNSKTTGSELGGSGLNNLTLNLTSGQTLTLDQSRTVSGTLTMTSGDINTGVNSLTLGTGTSSLGSLSRNSGTIIGNFQRWFAASTVSNVLFPIGTTSNYRPANISFTVAPSTGGTLTAFFTASDPGTGGLPLDDGGTSIVNAGKEGFWTINAADGLTGGTYSLDLTADGFSGVSVVSTLRLIKRSTGGNWTLDGSQSVGTGTTGTPVVHRTGMSGFSEFGVGGASDNPLPVELSSFSAIILDYGVKLNWRTETE